MNSLSVFPSILYHLNTKSITKPGLESRRKLKFVNQNQETTDQIEAMMKEYLRANLPKEGYLWLCHYDMDDFDQESRLCELLNAIIIHSETEMDRHMAMFEDILKAVIQVRQMNADGTDFREQVINKCSLLLYDSFAILRSMRKKIVSIAKTYHVPYYYYHAERKKIRLRSSLLTTYKNLCIIMDDSSLLSESLWFVRNLNYFEVDDEKSAKSGQDQQSQGDGSNGPVDVNAPGQPSVTLSASGNQGPSRGSPSWFSS